MANDEDLRCPLAINWEDLQVGVEIGTLKYSVSSEMVKDYVESVDDPDPWYLEDSPFGGPIVPPIYLCDDYLRLLIQGGYPTGEIHARAEYEFKRPIKHEMLLVVRAIVADMYVKRGRDYMVVETVTTDECGNEISRGKTTLLRKL
jgi:acyl dehydratase